MCLYSVDNDDNMQISLSATLKFRINFKNLRNLLAFNHHNIIFKGPFPETFTCFLRTKFIAWCLKHPSRGMLMGPGISGTTYHMLFGLCPAPTLKKDLLRLGREMDKYDHHHHYHLHLCLMVITSILHLSLIFILIKN